jgi:hypothetical protein
MVAVIVLPRGVFAEDDDNEYEQEYDDEREDRANQETTTTQTKQVTEYKPVTEIVLVVPEEYTKDSDGDKLVDALDPNPTIHQQEFFTDTDDDGVPNAFDKHHDEDDFAYYEQETDNNHNGIIDSYENQ